MERSKDVSAAEEDEETKGKAGRWVVAAAAVAAAVDAASDALSAAAAAAVDGEACNTGTLVM